MADYKEGQGVKTHRDNDFSGKIVDGQSGSTATDILTIAQPGDAVTADTNDYGIPVLYKQTDGTYCIPATDNACNQKVVIVDNTTDLRQHSYKNHSAIAAAASDDHDSTAIVSGSKVREVEVTVSSPGCMQFDIGVYDGTTTFTEAATLWTQPASPSQCCKISIPETTGDAAKLIRIKATNEDTTANDAYSTMCFIERL